MKTIAVIFGSRSAEHDVSIVTAVSAIIYPLKLSGKYNVVPVYISKDGSWYSDDELGDIDFYTSGDVGEKLSKLKKINLKFDDGLWIVKSGLGDKKIHIDVVFPGTHGTYGEDGSLMGLLEMANVPYVGCDVTSSAVAMDKALSKIVIMAHKILTPKMKYFSDFDYTKEKQEILEYILTTLRMPLFVKPVHLGSSIAVTRVKDKKTLENAIELAFHYDDKVVVEEEVRHLVEVTVPVMGNVYQQVAMVEETMSKSAEFFDFDTKYMQGGKKGKGGQKGNDNYSRMPAKLPKMLYKQCEQLALEAYKAIGCSGIARVDLLVDKKAKKVYFNEINPLPGGLYEHNWNKAGINNVELVQKLVDLAFFRSQAQAEKSTVFKTNFLSQF